MSLGPRCRLRFKIHSTSGAPIKIAPATLIDFRGATSHFADPDFDGDPVQIYEPGQNDPMVPPDVAPADGDVSPTPGADEIIVDQPPDISIKTDPEPIRKIYVDGVGATIVAERVDYLDENGRLITESLKDFTKKALKKRFISLDAFLKRWKSADRGAQKNTKSSVCPRKLFAQDFSRACRKDWREAPDGASPELSQ